ncbi:MAG: putative Ig domain-containing protein, partial [Proteobacteria bacterium]|nr:putative Ig domain-containing protein [Pseudomonadota bacterium]
TLNACRLSGTPATNAQTTGAQSFSITATNTGGDSNTITVDITVNPPVPMLSTPTAPAPYTTGTAITPLDIISSGGSVVSCASATTLPAGLSIDPVSTANDGTLNACRLSGTPAADALTDGAQSFSITATNAGGTSTAISISLTVNPPIPVLTDPTDPAPYTTGTAITPVDIISTGGSVVSCASATTLPAGLSIDPFSSANDGNLNACRISGTPANNAQTDGAQSFSITATNAGGTSTAITVSLTVNPIAPVLTDPNPLGPYTYNTGMQITPVDIISTAGPVASCASATTLPTGLSIEPFSTANDGILNACRLSGTPPHSAPTDGAQSFSITATNAGGTSEAITISITVNLSAPVLTEATPRSPYTYITDMPISPLDFISIGGPVVSCTSDPALPTGLSIDPFSTANDGILNACRISDNTVANAPTAGTQIAVITATNAGGTSNSIVISIAINPPIPVLADIASIGETKEMRTVALGVPLVTPIIFANTGGSVDGCKPVSANGNLLLFIEGGLTVTPVMDPVNNVQTCQITGTAPTTLVGFRPASDGLHRYTVTIAGTNGANDSGKDTATVELHLRRRSIEAGGRAVLVDIPTTIVYIGEPLLEPIIFANTGDSIDDDPVVNGTESCFHSSDTVRDDYFKNGLELSTTEDPANGVRTCQITGALPPRAPPRFIHYTIGYFTDGTRIPVDIRLDIQRRPPPILANITTPVEVAPDATLNPIIFPNTGEDVTSCAGVALAEMYADPTAAPLELTVDMVSDNGKMTCQITGTAPADGSMGVYGVQGTNSGGTSTATVTISVTE